MLGASYYYESGLLFKLDSSGYYIFSPSQGLYISTQDWSPQDSLDSSLDEEGINVPSSIVTTLENYLKTQYPSSVPPPAVPNVLWWIALIIGIVTCGTGLVLGYLITRVRAGYEGVKG
jgi:hypothetical protein